MGDALGDIETAPAALSVLGTATSLITATIIIIVCITSIDQEAGAVERTLASLLTDPVDREDAARV